jgi:cell division protease FtsH
LIEKETVSQQDMARLCASVQKRRPMAPYNGFGKRQPSDRPPVLTPAERDLLGDTEPHELPVGEGPVEEVSPGVGSTSISPDGVRWDSQH